MSFLGTIIAGLIPLLLPLIALLIFLPSLDLTGLDLGALLGGLGGTGS